GFGGRPLVCRPQQARALEPDTRGRAPAAREGREAEANPGPDPRNRGQSRGADTRAATPRRRAPGGARAKRGVAARQRPGGRCAAQRCGVGSRRDRKSTRLNSSHVKISYSVFGLRKKNTEHTTK